MTITENLRPCPVLTQGRGLYQGARQYRARSWHLTHRGLPPAILVLRPSSPSMSPGPRDHGMQSRHGGPGSKPQGLERSSVVCGGRGGEGG
eukprot:848207-Rhodomonas_salina.3